MGGQNSFLILAVVTVAIGYPLWRRWVPRNRWYGLRVAATFADAVVWYEANAAVGRDLMLTGGALLATSLVMRELDVPDGWYVAVCLVLVVAGSVISLTRASRHATKLLSERQGHRS
jgi:hypothetical protein